MIFVTILRMFFVWYTIFLKMTTQKGVKAVALYSGGLDSTLAILVMLSQGVTVEALCFLTTFGCDKNRDWILDVSKRFGFAVHFINIEDGFIRMLKNPRYGYGKNMNPCIDCRILMLREAKNFISEMNAQFVITGEVLNQRPLSQRRQVFKLIDRDAELEGYVLRPLTALNLDPTIPEKKGLVKRELLFGFEGRSRKPQMALAQKFGLTEYPTPAGGCLLTDPIFSFRLKELLRTNPEANKRDISLLRIGRHFRLSSNCKVIVGRNKKENEMLEKMSKKGDVFLRTVDFPGPTVLFVGNPEEYEIHLAATICARYSDGKEKRGIKVRAYRLNKDQNGNPVEELIIEYKVDSIDYDLIETLLIDPVSFQKSP